MPKATLGVNVPFTELALVTVVQYVTTLTLLIFILPAGLLASFEDTAQLNRDVFVELEVDSLWDIYVEDPSG